MKFPVILFDWGGVVADDPGDDFLTKLLVDMGATQPQIDEIFSIYMRDFMRGKINEADYWAKLRSVYGLQIPGNISEKFKSWRGLQANPEVLRLVAELRQTGRTCVIFSNVIEPTYNVLEEAGYYAQFDNVVASCKIGYAKPDQEMYDYVLKQRNISAAEVLLVDDKEHNLEPARGMGMTTIRATSEQQLISAIRQAID